MIKGYIVKFEYFAEDWDKVKNVLKIKIPTLFNLFMGIWDLTFCSPAILFFGYEIFCKSFSSWPNY